jgi:hypothetical protein
MKKLSDTYKELGIDFTFPIKIQDAKGKMTYYESRYGFAYKREYDSNGNETYREHSSDFWCKHEYDSNGYETYFEDSDGLKRGTPRSQSCDGKVVEVYGKKYKLKAL